MAWLHAIPEKKELSRMQTAKRAGDTATLEPPPIEGCGYLLEWFFECGPVNNGGMGPTPITWTDIKDWSKVCCVDITWKEASILKNLSSEYVNEYQEAKKPDRLPPGKTSDQVSQKIGSIFSNIQRKKNA